MVRDIVKSWVSSIASDWSDKFSNETLDTYKYIMEDTLETIFDKLIDKYSLTENEIINFIRDTNHFGLLMQPDSVYYSQSPLWHLENLEKELNKIVK